jgi:hypothetical protein
VVAAAAVRNMLEMLVQAFGIMPCSGLPVLLLFSAVVRVIQHSLALLAALGTLSGNRTSCSTGSVSALGYLATQRPAL